MKRFIIAHIDYGEGIELTMQQVETADWRAALANEFPIYASYLKDIEDYEAARSLAQEQEWDFAIREL